MSEIAKETSTSIDGVIRPIRKSEPALETDADIAAIGEGVLAGTHPYLNWTHFAHCAATIHLLLNRPEWVLEDHMPDIIRTYNTAIGVANTERSGYHQTLTLFYIRAIRDFLQPGMTPARAMANLRQSPLRLREYVFDFYSREHLFSTTARVEWVEPDLKPLPF
jgi:hypothetical protein